MSNILAEPGEVIRDYQRNHIATVKNTLHWPYSLNPDDFEWAEGQRIPKSGDKVPVAIDAFIARKKRVGRF